MRDFTTEFQNFIDDMLNDVIIDLKENNPKYAKSIMYIKENGAKVRDIIDGLPKDKRKLINMKLMTLIYLRSNKENSIIVDIEIALNF